MCKKNKVNVQINKKNLSYFTGYLINLMDSVFEEVVHDPLPYLDAVQRIPLPQYLSSQHDRPSMEEAVAEHVSRFSRGGSESDILPCSIRKLPLYVQHHTWRDDVTNTSSKETLAPADKLPVGQMSALPAGTDGEERRGEESTYCLF